MMAFTIHLMSTVGIARYFSRVQEAIGETSTRGPILFFRALDVKTENIVAELELELPRVPPSHYRDDTHP